MAKVIEAQAVISAVDETGSAFSAVANKVRGLNSAFKSLNGAAVGGMRGLNRTVGRIQSAIRTIAPIAGPAAGFEAAHGAILLVHDTVKAASDMAHEKARMITAGFKPEEVQEATDLSLKLSSKYKSLSQTDIMHTLRNMRSVVGTFTAAADIVDPLLKMRIAALGQHPERAAELDSDFDKLIKGMEIKGVTQDPAKFASYMNSMSKAINVFGDTLRMTDFYEMFKYGRASTLGLSERFMLETAPTLAQEMRGSSAGRAMSGFFTEAMGHTTQKAAEELMKLKLLDPSYLIRTKKTHEIMGFRAGGLHGTDLAISDPYQWVQDYLLPAIPDKDPKKIMEAISAMFPNQIVAQMMGIFAQQQARIEKDHQLVEGAQGLDAADTFDKLDPYIGMISVEEQFKNLLNAAASPAMPAAIAMMHSLADALRDLANVATAHPAAAVGTLATTVTGTAAAAGAATLWGARRFGRMFRGARAAAGVAESAAAAPTEEGVLAAAWEAAIASGPAAVTSLVGRVAGAAARGALRVAGPVGALLGMTDPAGGPEKAGYVYGPGGAYMPRSEAQWLGNVGAVPALGAGGTGSALDTAKTYMAGPMTAEVKPDQIQATVRPDQIEAVVRGEATLNTKVEVTPSPDFWTKVKQEISNGITAFRNSGGAPATGTAGSTGKSMPEVKANPQ